MTVSTLDPVIASRLLSEVVESPRALRALYDAGFKTLGGVAEKGISSIVGLKHVGEATRALILKALGPIREDPEPEPEIEEGVHPIRLESPFPGFQMALSPANRVMQPGGGFAVQRSIFIEFQDGEAALSKESWLTRIYQRDPARVSEGMANAALPWRAQAIAWLRGHDTYARGEFRVLVD